MVYVVSGCGGREGSTRARKRAVRLCAACSRTQCYLLPVLGMMRKGACCEKFQQDLDRVSNTMKPQSIAAQRSASKHVLKRD